MGVGLELEEQAFSGLPEVEEYLKRTRKSEEVFSEVSGLIPGGVNSAIQFFEPYPVYGVRGSGSRLWDVDGNEYIDFLSFLWGYDCWAL